MNIYRKLVILSIFAIICNSALLAYRYRSSYTESPQDYFYAQKTLVWCTVQFPKTIQKIPDIRIYYSGQRIKCETNNDLKRITFAIPDETQKNQFKLMIADKLDFYCEHKVVQYLKISRRNPYKFYIIDSTAASSPLCSLEDDISPSDRRESTLAWHVRELHNPLENGRIPDDTIIVCWNPAYVEVASGGSCSTLVTLNIRKDILDVVGSEQKLHEKADELILSLIDYDTIHAAMHQDEMHPTSNPKTVLTITT